MKTQAPLLIEGYASLFHRDDCDGDVVRAGAFARTLARPKAIPMLWQHRPADVAGRWVRIFEDGRGLFVRGLIESPKAIRRAETGLDGLSIGFRPKTWREHGTLGRELTEIDLIEISLVERPCQAGARFLLTGTPARLAA
jgi:hypothetical protein